MNKCRAPDGELETVGIEIRTGFSVSSLEAHGLVWGWGELHNRLQWETDKGEYKDSVVEHRRGRSSD